MKVEMIFLSLLSLCTVACTSAPLLSCAGTNWYELGRQQGRSGQAELDSSEALKACKGNSEEATTMMYSGFENGRADYCSPANAFNMARLGLKAPESCPTQLSAHLNESYQNGVRYRELESMQRALSSRLVSLNQIIADPNLSLAKRGLIQGERLQVLENDQKIKADLSKLSE